MTAVGIFGAVSSASGLRIGFSLLAVLSAGVCGGLVNRRAFLRSGRWALLRTIGLLGVLMYFALIRALAYGDRAVSDLVGGAVPWRVAFVVTAVSLLAIGFELSSRAFRRPGPLPLVRFLAGRPCVDRRGPSSAEK